MITDDSGRQVEVPVKPERIVTDWYLGQILAVGVKPLMGNVNYAEFLKQHYEDGEILEIGDVETSYEKIIELKPDLIVTWSTEYAENYSKIAPTIVFGDGTYDSPQEEILSMGKMLGREEEAQAFVEDFDQRIAVAREKILNVVPEGSTFSLFSVYDKSIMAMKRKGVDGGKALYELLGMKPSSKIQELFDTEGLEEPRYTLSFETVGDYVGDFVLANIDDSLVNLPSTWTNLEAVKNNEVIKLDIQYYFAVDPLSALHQAEDMADKIVEMASKK